MEPGRIRIKVCGITRQEDALCAASAGVDALGFIFHRKSPRYIAPEEARQIIDQLPPFIDTVGVFVDRELEEVEEIIHYCRLSYVQLHGEESPKFCERMVRFVSPCQIIKAFRVGPQTTAEEFEAYTPYVRAFLLDTYDKELVGGTGRSFDWSLIDKLRLARPYILAGGLSADNIGAALQAGKARGVDVNSGVEIRPGIKDHRLVRDFVATVRKKEEEGCS
jgi:phosphoribosylanthranilate isomerase